MPTNRSSSRASGHRRKAKRPAVSPAVAETRTGEIAFCKIYPPIGIARLGDSRDADGWFIGPEFAGQEAHRADGFSFRDAAGCIKRQAVRFRVFAFTRDGEPLGELTAKEAEITWRVELANKKAAWFEFRGAEKALKAYRGEADRSEVPRERNAGIGAITRDPATKTYRSNANRAAQLEIHGGAREVSGRSQGGIGDDGTSKFRFIGTFRNKKVELGEVRTDADGRLLVLGGFGESDAVDEKGNSIRSARWIRNYANNDGWYDDTSDGPVTATVRLKTGRAVEVTGAWVVVASPDFAPDVTNLVTLYDVMEEVVARNPALVSPGVPTPRQANRVYFDTDIAPVLQRMHAYRWVSASALRGHGFGKPGDFHEPGKVEQLQASLGDPDPKSTGGPIRRQIFGVLRRPHYQRGPRDSSTYDSEIALKQATGLFMPPLAGDEGDPVPGDPTTWAAVTHLQYARLEAWQRGEFQRGADPTTPSNEIARQIFDLTRTALEACAGGAFYPGIEMTVTAREPSMYVEGFRFDHRRLRAGDVTKYMALPWQADFWECSNHWWPAQRPDDVVTDEDFALLLTQFTEEISGDFKQQFDRVLFNRRRWDRGLGRRARPSGAYLSARLLPPVRPDEQVREYADLLSTVVREASHPGYERFQAMDPLGRLFASLTPALPYTRLKPVDEPGSADRLPNPWRLQYLCQEALDAYSGLYFHLLVPPPEACLDQADLADGTRRDWKLFRMRHPARAAALIKKYAEAIIAAVSAQISAILLEHPAATSADTLHKALLDALDPDAIATLELENPHDFSRSSPECGRLQAADMLAQARDALYLRILRYSGDEDMVDQWADHGFVVQRDVHIVPKSDETRAGFNIRAQVEVARSRYDGLSFRDYFYILMNIEHYEDFIPYARVIVDHTLQYAQSVIDTIGLADKSHPESFIEYSRESLAAKLEEIYETLRNQAATSLDWRTTRTRADAVQRIRDNAPFNQTDGAWLRYIANAGPTDKVRSLLFEVWSDEIGSGDPGLHHGNFYTALLTSLGILLPSVSSRAYADNPDIDESSFIGPVFELAISLHSEAYFPELLGMTLFLEWEVLSLVPGIKRNEYLGIDAQFWRMHVGIDNASEGHGAMARKAIEIYLDHVFTESGEAGRQAEWRRIWRGFVAFAVGGGDYFGNGDDQTIARRHPGTPEGDVMEVMQRKARYGSLNHLQHRLGTHRLNDLFDNPDVFVEELANSPWVVAGDPDTSRLLSYLTTFSGPMYKVFDKDDLSTWRRWIEWLGQEGDTTTPKEYISKADAMLLLLNELRELAMGHAAHRRYTLAETPAAGRLPQRFTVAEMFSRGDLKDLMRALRDPGNGWVVPGNPGASPLIVDLARANNAMGRALDRRYPALANQIGRIVVIRWIEAGCPLPDEAPPDITTRAPKWDGKQLLVQQLGIGAVH